MGLSLYSFNYYSIIIFLNVYLYIIIEAIALINSVIGNAINTPLALNGMLKIRAKGITSRSPISPQGATTRKDNAFSRALVVGSPGVGKSTFARKLRNRCGLPLVYLDMIWHQPDGTNVTHEEFDAQLDIELARERWIIDGNYLRTLERRLARAFRTRLEGYRARKLG